MSTFSNISLLVKHLVEDERFEQYLGRGIGIETSLCNVFGKDTTKILSKVALKNYLNCARENWQNVNMQVNSTRDGDVDDTVEEKGRNTKFDIKN